MNIEARTMIDIASKHIIPAVIRGTKTLAETVNAVVQAGVDAEVQRDLLVETSSLLKEAKAALTTLEQVTQEAAKAHAYHDEIVPVMDRLRAAADQLEMIVDKEIWPMPSYGDLIFEV